MTTRKYSAQEIIDLINNLKSNGDIPEDVTSVNNLMTESDVSKLDIVEVSRKAHEISAAHGQNGWRHAEKLAAVALASRHLPGHQFWETVAAAFKAPRMNLHTGCY